VLPVYGSRYGFLCRACERDVLNFLRRHCASFFWPMLFGCLRKHVFVCEWRVEKTVFYAGLEVRKMLCLIAPRKRKSRV
jgi:hypothetical protein